MEAPELDGRLMDAVRDEIRVRCEGSGVDIAAFAVDLIRAIALAGFVILSPEERA